MFCRAISQFSRPYCVTIKPLFIDGQSDMEDNFDSTIHEVAVEFEATPTTEDTRTGIDRRHTQSKGFPLQDKSGTVIEKERRIKNDRRCLEIDIDDISEYTQENS